MTAASSAWARKAPKARQRSYSGKPISEQAQADWERLTALAGAAKHPAARAFLIDQRARLLRRATTTGNPA
jgi:hypothetical protein